MLGGSVNLRLGSIEFINSMPVDLGLLNHRVPLTAEIITGSPAKLNDMLAMGKSQPWPDALQAMTGQRQIDATAIIDYFAPLKTWLDDKNKGQTCGW